MPPIWYIKRQPAVEITDWYELDAVRLDLDGNYTLMNDLDTSTYGFYPVLFPNTSWEGEWEAGTYNEDDLVFHDNIYWIANTTTTETPSETSDDWGIAPGWLPFSFGTDNFSGIFDGNGHTISDLYIYRRVNYPSLFGYTRVPVAIPSPPTCIIKNLGVLNVNIYGRSIIGALIGYQGRDTRVENCYSTGNLKGLGTGFGDAGYVGGLVGYIRRPSSEIYDSYSTANVEGRNQIGGFIGTINQGFTRRCFSTGLVTGTESDIGGFAGSLTNNGEAQNCFWDIETSGQTTSAGGEGKTTVEMQFVGTFSEKEWDIELILDESNTYPYLSWEVSNNSPVWYINQVDYINLSKSRIKTLQSEDNQSNSRLKISTEENNTSNANINTSRLFNNNSNARLLMRNLHNNNLNSRISIMSIESRNSNARLLFLDEKNNTSNARLLMRDTNDNNSNARLLNIEEYNNTSNARIVFRYDENNNSNARIKINYIKDNFSNSRIKIQDISDEINSNSRLSFRFLDDNNSNARININYIKENYSNSRLKIIEYQNQNFAIGRIYISNLTETIVGNSRIKINYLDTNQSVGRLTLINQETNESLSRIRINYESDNYSNSRLILGLDENIFGTGAVRVNKIQSQNITDSRLKILYNYQNQSNARITTISYDNENYADSRIKKSIDELINSNSTIKILGLTVNNTANADLKFRFLKNNYGNSKIYVYHPKIGGAKPILKTPIDSPIVSYIASETAMGNIKRTRLKFANANSRIEI